MSLKILMLSVDSWCSYSSYQYILWQTLVLFLCFSIPITYSSTSSTKWSETITFNDNYNNYNCSIVKVCMCVYVTCKEQCRYLNWMVNNIWKKYHQLIDQNNTTNIPRKREKKTLVIFYTNMRNPYQTKKCAKHIKQIKKHHQATSMEMFFVLCLYIVTLLQSFSIVCNSHNRKNSMFTMLWCYER